MEIRSEMEDIVSFMRHCEGIRWCEGVRIRGREAYQALVRGQKDGNTGVDFTDRQ